MEQLDKSIWRFPLAIAAVLLLGACGKAEKTAQPLAAPKVSVAEVIEQPVNDWDELTGRLEAPESVEVRPRVSGYIDRVAFAEGRLVKKGDLLFQIDPRPFEAEVKRLQAQLQQARANQTRAVSEAQRGERLRQSNAISAELADARNSAAAEAQAAPLEPSCANAPGRANRNVKDARARTKYGLTFFMDDCRNQGTMACFSLTRNSARSCALATTASSSWKSVTALR